MTNPNVIWWIGSVERFNRSHSERPFYQDEQQFYLFHPPMPTENGKQLQHYFDERSEVEKEKFSLREDERKLVDKFDNLNRNLMEVKNREVSTIEEAIAKEEQIKAIQEQIQKVIEDITKIKEEIENKEKEIDMINEKINEMIEIVIEDEHKLNEQQQEFEKEKNDKKVESLIAQL